MSRSALSSSLSWLKSIRRPFSLVAHEGRRLVVVGALPRARPHRRPHRHRHRLLLEARGDDGDDDVLLLLGLDHRAPDDLRVLGDRLLHDVRGLVHLLQRQVRPAGHVDQHRLRAVDRAVLQQRRGDRALRRLDRAVVAARHPDAHHRPAHARHDGAHVGEVHVHEARDRHQVGDPGHRLAQDVVGHPEGVQQRGLAVHDAEQPLVRDRDQRVDVVAQLRQALLGLAHAPLPLEREGLGHHADGEDPHLLGDVRDDRRRAGAGAAAEPGGDEEQVGPLDRLGDARGVLVRRLAADLGVGAGAEALGQLRADLELRGGERVRQGLQVGVGRDELHPVDAGADHRVHRVAAAAADPDHPDVGPQHHVLLDLEVHPPALPHIVQNLEPHRRPPPVVPLPRRQLPSKKPPNQSRIRFAVRPTNPLLPERGPKRALSWLCIP